MYFLSLALLFVMALAVMSLMRGGNQVSRFANVIYWLACGITFFLIAASVLAAVTGYPDPNELAGVAVFALLVWLAGLAARYIVRNR